MERSDRFLKMAQVMEMVGLSRSGVYKAISMGVFPKQIKLGTGEVKVAARWSEIEVQDWMDALKGGR